MINKTCPQPSLFSSLADQLNPKHPLYQLADKIDWQRFEASFSPLYSADNGRPAKPIRLMCGLLILKHVRNLSDESVVEQWSENAYYQYFCGMFEFTPSFPCNASELVHFRKRIGEKGMELILSESIRVNQEDDDRDHHGMAFIDSTVQEKNVTYPTDEKLDCPQSVVHRENPGFSLAPELHFRPQEDLPGPTLPQPSEEPRQGLEGGQAAAHHCGKACQGIETQPGGEP